MQEIINLRILRFKSIQLRNMKPYVFILMSLLSTMSYAQIKNLPTELGMAYGSFHHKSGQQSSPNYINNILVTDIDFSNFTESNWYPQERDIRNYEITGAKRIHQSKNLRREFYIGAKVAGQFQRRTLFIGTIEKLEEEMIIDQKTGSIRQLYSFQTAALSELNDYLNVSPYCFNRFLINDHLSINASASAGVLVPLKTGIQETKYTGNIKREYDGENLILEQKSYDGELQFNWYSVPFKPRFRFEAAINLEFKPFDKKPYYLTVGSLIGRQLSTLNRNNFTYSGVRIGIQSQF
ncbi:MAG: type II restriction/modification system DNA methylase subunit YeeA [Bacteroidia bacterium]|jgi:type II restriction/modification system DNA methylase subunit YeeA